MVLFAFCISCKEEEINEFTPSNNTYENIHAVLSNEQLTQIAQAMVSFINEEDVKAEIYSYATPASDYEVYRPFKTIFDDEGINGRKKSIFGSKLIENLKGCSSCRTTDASLDSIINLLEEHYVISAPYLAEDFSGSQEAITISWWDGIDTTGVTPGILSSDLKVKGKREVISVDDHYADSHPTIVIMPLDSDLSSDDICLIDNLCDSNNLGQDLSNTRLNSIQRI